VVVLKKIYPISCDKNHCAGYDFLNGFIQQIKIITLRKAEHISLARATSFTPANVAILYQPARGFGKKFKPGHILNFNESCVVTVVHSPLTIAEKGRRQVGQILRAERRQLLTFGGIITAGRNAYLPVFVFPWVE
jgi:hypothetical protein